MIHLSKMLIVDDAPLWRSMMARRVSWFVSFVLGLALGTGIAVLLSPLSVWFSSYPVSGIACRSFCPSLASSCTYRTEALKNNGGGKFVAIDRGKGDVART